MPCSCVVSMRMSVHCKLQDIVKVQYVTSVHQRQWPNIDQIAATMHAEPNLASGVYTWSDTHDNIGIP